VDAGEYSVSFGILVANDEPRHFRGRNRYHSLTNELRVLAERYGTAIEPNLCIIRLSLLLLFLFFSIF
jgi:hypothetical protein